MALSGMVPGSPVPGDRPQAAIPRPGQEVPRGEQEVCHFQEEPDYEQEAPLVDPRGNYLFSTREGLSPLGLLAAPGIWIHTP